MAGRLSDVVRVVGARRQGNVYVAKCPFHDDGGRPNLVLYSDHYHCFVCGAHGGFGKLLERFGVPSLKASPDASPSVLEFRSPPPPPAEPSRINLANKALIEALVLSDEHRDQLRARGFEDGWIDWAEYRSLPPGSRVDLSAKVSAIVPLDSVPGWYMRDDGSRSLAGPSGILIPIRDISRNVRGFQIRRDEKAGSSRYSWLSSSGRPQGASAKASAHVSFPMSGDQDLRCLWVTEGPLKGDYLSARVGAVCVSVPGVSLWRLAVKESVHSERVNLAFDMDESEASIAAVRAAEEGFCSAVSWARIRKMRWAEAKGVDDALEIGGVLDWETD